MGVELPPDDDTAGTDLASLQDTLDSDSIVFVDSLGAEIDTRLRNTASLQYKYVVGDVAEYRVHGGHAYFDLVHDTATIKCVIFNVEQTPLTTDIDNGMQVAVNGTLSFTNIETAGSKPSLIAGQQ